MPVRTVLVHAETSEKGKSLLKAAADFAGGRDAHLVALVIGLEPTLPYGSMIDVPVETYSRDLDNARASTRDLMRDVEAYLSRYSTAFEVRGATVPTGLAGSEFARHARYADLSIFPPRDGDSGMQHLIDATLFESGRPVLLTPTGVTLDGPCRRVAIAWDASREASRAVHDSLLVMAPGAEVRIVVVDPHVAPEHHGEEPGSDIATMLSRHGLRVSVDALPSADRTFCETFLEHARDMDADLLVSGAYGHSRLRQILLGGNTRDLMEMVDRPLLMSH